MSIYPGWPEPEYLYSAGAAADKADREFALFMGASSSSRNIGWGFSSDLVQDEGRASILSGSGVFGIGYFFVEVKRLGFRFEVDSGYVTAIPEPSTWIMLTVGFGLLGGMLRRAGLAREANLPRPRRQVPA